MLIIGLAAIEGTDAPLGMGALCLALVTACELFPCTPGCPVFIWNLDRA